MHAAELGDVRNRVSEEITKGPQLFTLQLRQFKVLHKIPKAKASYF